MWITSENLLRLREIFFIAKKCFVFSYAIKKPAGQDYFIENLEIENDGYDIMDIMKINMTGDTYEIKNKNYHFFFYVDFCRNLFVDFL